MRRIDCMQIAIIGAGLSGRLLALNLRRHGTPHVLMVDRGAPGSMGPAYSDDAATLLLNVPAGRMGAFPDDPEHFLRWARENGADAGPLDFLPRGMYRRYVLDLLRQVERDGAEGPALEQLRGNVTDIEPMSDGLTLRMDGNDARHVDVAVLALGNFPPRHPSVRNTRALESGRYFRNPWSAGVLDSLSPEGTLLLIGTGQTMVDLLVTLAERGHRGRIVAVSRRGVLPMSHRSFETYPSFIDDIRGERSILALTRAVRRHVAHAKSIGVDPRAVIDSLRPDTQSLWLDLPVAEKRRFVRHVFRHWEVIRSRIPPASEAVVERLRASGQLEIVAGRVADMEETDGHLDVRYTRRDGTSVVEHADVVVNCVGPETDLARVDDVLVTNLLRRGLIRPGPANLGLDALPDGAIVGRDGTPSTRLYTLGAPMKGVLWEVLAVPDIRVQAQRLAQSLFAR